eukprot:TRINITY_DN66423_c1_g1_i1.p1 TRINITY_DN66423_c1_g1~~TRINITY_DN66423_c1_g1_i1.p1  ORF type:complete len:327 (-),score=155.00 TRINITY_DN66423_c1_g1_i1:68-988(-)
MTTSWGDNNPEQGSSGGSVLIDGLPPRQVIGPDAEGIKVVVDYHRDSDGKLVKTTRRLKVGTKTVKMSRSRRERIAARRKWRKFGACAGLPAGVEPNVTYVANDDVTLHLKRYEEDEEVKEETAMEKARKKNANSGVMVCRKCGQSGHWTLKCPLRNEIGPAGAGAGAGADAGAAPSQADAGRPGSRPGSQAGAAASGGRYVPPSRRAGASRDRSSRYEDEDAHTLRITNLSEDTTDDDLHDLLRPFGRTQRVFLAKDHQTGVSRGFAYVTFISRSDAEEALDALNGHGFDNLILHVDWAKPKKRT